MFSSVLSSVLENELCVCRYSGCAHFLRHDTPPDSLAGASILAPAESPVLVHPAVT